MQRDVQGTCTYRGGHVSFDATLNRVSDNPQSFLQNKVVHPAFLGKCQPKRVVFDLFELWSYSFAIPVLLECVPNLSFNSFKENVGAMLDFLCMSQIWRFFVWYITQCYLDRLLRVELCKDLT